MIKCENCKFFKPYATSSFSGICDIQLPPFIKYDSIKNYTIKTEGCDLGKLQDKES